MILGVLALYYHGISTFTHPFQPISTIIFAAHHRHHLVGGNGGFVPGALQHVLSRLGHLLRTFLGGSRGPKKVIR